MPQLKWSDQSVRFRVISGGQTGVDRAALNAAMKLKIPVSGFCPKGRKAEDGKIPERYPLIELGSSDYQSRTKANVEVADATLIVVNSDKYSAGTKLTISTAARLQKIHLIVDIRKDELDRTIKWFSLNNISILNVAGPRESGSPGIGIDSEKFLSSCFKAVIQSF